MKHDYTHQEHESNRISEWLDASGFALRSGISERAARNALAGAEEGRRWRGVMLTVRTVPGAGGPNGLKRQVLAESIPGAESSALVSREIQSAPSCPPPPANSAAWSQRLEIIGPALRAKARSTERAALIASAAQRHGIAERTLREWIASYEAGGAATLCRQPRADRGRARVIISREWDRAVAFSDETKAEIAEKLKRYLRSLWRSGASGWRHVVRMASVELAHLTRAAGADLGDAQLSLACIVPRHLAERERRFQLVAIKEKDAKRFFDRCEPRVRRSREGIAPMDIVGADVHHADIFWRRADGSICTPKLISWHDEATGRFAATMVLCAPGEGVRQEHVVSSFIDLTQHEHWGMPRTLYLDNGGEFAKLGFVDDAMKLADMAHQLGLSRRSMIVKARPYNAPAKRIEGIFGILERGPFAMLKGWVGGNRMRKKTHNVGKEPVPFPGDEAELAENLKTAIAYYNSHRQSGHLDGKSPDEAFAEAVARGWQRIDVDRRALEAVFARDEIRTVKQGEFTLGRVPYRHDALGKLLPDAKVRVRVPVIGTRDEIAVFDEADRFLCIASPAPFYPMLDAAGAREKSARVAAQTRAISLMRRDTDALDLAAEMRRAVPERLLPTPQSGGVIRLAPEHQAVAEAQREAPADRNAREADRARRARETVRQARRNLLDNTKAASG